MLHKIKKLVPTWMTAPYHWALAWISAIVYRFPSNKLIVIGVTGTNGKSSTIQFIAQMLEGLGKTVGYTGTAGFYIAGETIENKMKMTMPGRFFLQRLLRDMVRAKCQYALVETTSQGIEQYRHLGINYDVVLFTNLTPEHIESHGGFDQYKAAKGKLFAHLTNRKRKVIGNERMEKTSVINADDPHASYFSKFDADRHVKFSWSEDDGGEDVIDVHALSHDIDGAHVKINNVDGLIPMHALFQQKNAVATLSVVHSLGFGLRECMKVMENLDSLPGRFEIIDEGQDFQVIVDYAYEPYALEALLSAAEKLPHKRIIGVHGSCGGGRDVARRDKIGRLAGHREDVVIVTNEDPYDEDPRCIIEAVAKGVKATGKREGESLFIIDDRMEAIQHAIDIAKKGDIVLLTGKGSETVMAVAGGRKTPWSDREAAHQALKRRKASSLV